MCVKSLTTTDNLWKFYKESYVMILRNILLKPDSFLQIQWATFSDVVFWNIQKDMTFPKKYYWSKGPTSSVP